MGWRLTASVTMLLYIPDSGWVLLMFVCNYFKLVEAPFRQLATTDLKKHQDKIYCS